MSIHSSVETSWPINDIGNSGARSSGPSGCFVCGLSGGSGSIPDFTMSGMMLNHAVGIWSGCRSNRVRTSLIR